MATAPPPGKITCPHCQGLIKAPALAVGSAVNCPKCGKAFRLGEGSGFGVQGSGTKQETGDREQVTGDSGKKGQPPKAAKPPAVVSTEYSVPKPPPQIATPQSQAANSNPQASPKPKKPDSLVDPNMLPPPPPRIKEKANEVAVVCRLCGTRIHVKLAKIGQEVKCPDCHSRNLVVGPKEEGTAKAKGPTLEGTEDYGMSEVVQRPKYRPLQAARGEYEVLSALDPAAIEHRLAVPSEKPRNRKLVAAPAEDQTAEADEPHRELTLEAPVERAEAARDPRTVLPQPELQDEDPLYDGRYDDGVLGDRVDPRNPDAWKKAPLVYGIVEFLFRPGTILRWIMFSALLTMVAGLAKLGVAFAQQEDKTQAVVLFVLWAGIPLLATWLFSFAAAFHAIVEATGNGEEDVTTWPDWNVFGWFGPAFYVLIAAVAAAVPGGLIGAATLAASRESPLMAAFGIGAPVVLSVLVLFPIFYCSMLIEDNIMAVMSGYTVRSFTIAGDAWIYSYMYSLVLALLGTGAVATAAAPNMLFSAVGAAATVAVLIIYARLLGRLMWVAAEREKKYGG